MSDFDGGYETREDETESEPGANWTDEADGQVYPPESGETWTDADRAEAPVDGPYGEAYPSESGQTWTHEDDGLHYEHREASQDAVVDDGETDGTPAEDTRGEPAYNHSKNLRTRLDDRATINERAAHESHGRVTDRDGQNLTGTFGWVIDEETGNLLFLNPDLVVVHIPGQGTRELSRQEFLNLQHDENRPRGITYERIHHTTPVGAMPVTGAGIMELDDGWIVSVSDSSGHYQPTATNQYNALVALEQDGYALTQSVSAADSPDGVAGYRGATISITGGVGTDQRPTSKAEWIAWERANNPYISEDELTLKWEQFQQTGGNETVARRRDALNHEFAATFQQGEDGSIEWLTDLASSPEFQFDPSNGLYLNLRTYAYHSGETLQVVYTYDATTGKYFDRDGNMM